MFEWLAFFEWEDTEKFRPERYELASVCQEIRGLAHIMLAAPGTMIKATPPLDEFLQKYTNRFKPQLPTTETGSTNTHAVALMRAQFRRWAGVQKGASD
jgi:ABC-type branched-subunit amino acid transport system substrate-binding protein